MRDARTRSFSAPGVTYGELAPSRPQGLARHNLASLPHISVAGAVATATHGSGDATAAWRPRYRDRDGDGGRRDRAAARGDPEFDGLAVGLGAIGAVIRLTLDVEPSYEVRQSVFEGLAWDALYEHFDAITACGYSVSVFTRWGDAVDQVWVKSRDAAPSELFGARPATVDRHPILGLDAVNTTPQLGARAVGGTDCPHFRRATPSSGAGAAERVPPPAHARRRSARDDPALARWLRPVLLISEIRTVTADGLWMSPVRPGHRRRALHVAAGRAGVADCSRCSSRARRARRPPPLGRPLPRRAAERAALPASAGLPALRDRHDPRGAFRNAWLEARLGG